MNAPGLPPSVSRGWRPREDAWTRRAPSPYAGRPGRPLFIGGCPRSGTTLLQVTLDMHPELGIPRESNFIRELWWQRVRFGDLADPANRRRMAEWIFADPDHHFRRLKHRRISRDEAVAQVAAAGPTIGSVVERCLRLHAYDKPRWGDKRPAYSGFVGPLLRMFPDALYINVVRDPRGATASQLTMGWDAPETAVASAAVRWEFAIRSTDHFARALRPDQFLDVRYEDLATDPEPQIERILVFAGLSSGREIVERLAHGDRDGWFRGPHLQAGEPVTAAPVERWRERLTTEEVALVEHVAAGFMERFGYVPAAGQAASERDMEDVARCRRAFRRQWWRSRLDERVRLLRYRKPVAAEGHA